MGSITGGTHTCSDCGEHWPAGLHEVVQLDGCPACNPAWAGVVPTSNAEGT